MSSLSPEATDTIISTLEKRFTAHMERHSSVRWSDIEQKLRGDNQKLSALALMEETGWEPDVVITSDGSIAYYDCATESPSGRRSLCFDRVALDGKKENKPKSSVEDMARDMGVELLTESEYRHLQTLGKYDQKTSSWIATPDAIRKLGGALFCDRRYETVFTYHNGADSYYAARGWRGVLRVNY